MMIRHFDIEPFFKDKVGLEIGGTSSVFEKVYSIATKVDRVNLPEVDTTDLSSITTKYDFVISSNVLEHVANPLRAILQQKEILKENGVLVAVVPKKECCFDCKRETTSIEHLMQDFINRVNENDLSHAEEVLSTFDFTKHPINGGVDALKEQSINNFTNRFMHHHVFDNNLLNDVFIFCGLKIIFNGQFDGANYIIIGQREN